VFGQQISLKAATNLVGRAVAEFGHPVAECPEVPQLVHAFPRPERFATESLEGLRIPKARAATLAGIAAATIADPRLFEPGRDLADVVARLRKLGGVGEWTAQYIAMRALGESDAFLFGDVGVHRRLAQLGLDLGHKELVAHAERWRPWRAYAVMYLWKSDSDSAA
jgi:AraC family transcriptional regulator of adaptative response / DNA-3-methyladenine glycosylase II